MDREQKNNDNKDDKSKERISHLFPPREDIPASLSIQQAEELEARIRTLEAELAQKQETSGGKTASDKGTAFTTGEISTVEEEIKPTPTGSASRLQKTRASLGTAAVNFVRQFGQSRIQTRLTALIFIAIIPLLMGITFFLSSISASRIEMGANTELQGTTQGLGTTVSTWLELNTNALQELTLLSDTVSMDAKQQKQVLQAMSQAYPYMYLVSTTDLNGYNVARNDNEALTDYSDRDWYRGARAGTPVTYQILIGKTSGQPALVVSMPIKTVDGKIVGVGMFAAELTALSDQTRVTTIGESGYTYIVDANNRVLAHPDQAFTANELRDLSNYPPVAAIRQGKTGVITFTDENGQSWRAHASVLDNGWAVIAQRPENEILAPARQFRTVVTLMIMLGGGLIIALVWYAIRRTLQPIATLTDTITAISAGDLNRVIEVKSRDEIGVLASTFNNMTSQLRDMIGNLEQRVEERTHNLELASEVGRTITENVADIHQMLTKAVETIRARFNLYYTQIYLMDPSGRTITLRAGTGNVGRQLLSRGHRLQIGPGSLNGRAVAEKKAFIVSDTSQRADFLPNPLLPNTRSEMVVPLIVGGKVIGTLDMQSEVSGTFSEANLPAFEVLAGQFAVAVQNASLFAETAQVRRQMEANTRRGTELGWQDFLDGIERGERIGFIYDQNETVALDGSQAPLSADALSTPITITGATVGAIQTTLDQRELTPNEQEILKATAAQLGQHIEGLRLLTQTEQYHRQAQQVSRRLTSEGWREYFQTRKEIADGFSYSQDNDKVQPLNGNGKYDSSDSVLTHPLTVRDEPIGVMMVDSQNGSNSNDTELIAAVAEQLSDHIENLRLLEQAEQRRLELETVATVSSTVSTVLDPDKLLQTVVDMTKERFALYHAHIYLADDDWQTLLLAAGAGEIGREMVSQKHTIPMNMEQSLVARASRERKTVIANDVKSNPNFLPNPLLPDTRSEMAVPMIVGNNVLGVFDVQSDKSGGFSKEDADIYTTLASQVAVALQNARLYVEQAATVTQLRELDRLKSAFLANMSHELRTPLNSILGFTDVMLEGLDGDLTDYMDNDLRLIQKNGRHLLHLINDVLDMAKIESGRMNLHPETFKVHDIFEEVASITAPLASEKNVSLFIDEDSDQKIEVYADNTRLRQVMINLVNNSIKFTDQGKIVLSVKPIDGARVLISVKDTGIGIPPDHLESVFQEFTQVDTTTTRKAGGTGLGLPISRRLIEMHGGRLWAESTGVDGEGSTFFVEMPVEAHIADVVEKQEK